MRIFLDWGPPLQAILLQVLPQHPTYVGRLLHAFGDETGTAVTPSATVFPKPAIDLTPREMDVLQAIAVGLSNKEIEETLFISKNTVRTHIKNLYSKLGVESRTQAIARARSLNLI
ncbi:MAG: response regulator transcription factor [Chloroflexi bacterium]|nr:response regulator transcription factor [Chloroflexota bacterium]